MPRRHPRRTVLKRGLLVVAALLVAATIAFFVLAPGIVERARNKVEPKAAPEVTEHVGLGSDFDGSVTTPWDTGQLALVTQALLDRGFTEEEIAAVMGGNVLRVLLEVL